MYAIVLQKAKKPSRQCSQAQRYTCDRPLYCSHDGADGMDEDHRDFAVLPVRIQGRVRRNPMGLQRSELAMRGIIVGHPQGGYK